MKKKQKSISIFLSLIFLTTLAPLPFSKVVHAETGTTISTIVGTTGKMGVSGYSGDNGAATSAQLNGPMGVASDSSGNIYIADSRNNAVRRIDGTNGNISTIAGTGPKTSGPGSGMFPGGWPGSQGSGGYSGDNGLATSAELNNPVAVAVGSSGAIYISDGGNDVIRKIDESTKNISTVAGTGPWTGANGDDGVATKIRLIGPQGVAVDSDGNVYVADAWGNRIRKINIEAQTISTVAGTGTPGYSGDNGIPTSAKLNNPVGIAIAKSGNIYISDAGNNVIRKIDHKTGNISTVAGTGTGGYSGDNGLAISAQLSNPMGLAVDSDENLYIADDVNNRIRKIDYEKGIISTIAGTGARGYSEGDVLGTSVELDEPTGVAVDSSGNVYIADELNCVIRKIDKVTGKISTIAGTTKNVPARGYSGDNGLAVNAELNEPMGVTFDGKGVMYIADTYNNVIRKVDKGGTISTIAGTGTSGYSGDNGQATSAQLGYPAAVAADIYGNIYIADHNNSVIRKVDTNGNIITIAGTGTAGYSGDNGPAKDAKLGTMQGVAVDDKENVYIADTYNEVVRKVDKGGTISTIAGTGTSGYSGDNGQGINAKLNEPMGVAADNKGNVYIADTGNNRLRKVDASGIITTIAGTGTAGYSGDSGKAISAELRIPKGVAVDQSGNVYINDTNNGVIRKVDTSGIISTIAGTGTLGYNGDNGAATSVQLGAPQEIAVDGSGNVYIADMGNNKISKITMPSSSYTVTYDGNGNTSGTAPTDSTSYNSGASVTAQYSMGLTRDGFRFAGWNTSKDGNGITVPAGRSFNITGSTILYAQWEQIVPASGLTVTVSPEIAPVLGKVNLTVTPGVSGINDKILYKIVDSDPTALNVGDEIEPDDGWTEVTGTNAQEISVANGKYIEAVEVQWGTCDVVKWGKSGIVNDGYVKPDSPSLDKTTASFDKKAENQADINISMGIDKYELNNVTALQGSLPDNILQGNTVTIKKSDLVKNNPVPKLIFSDGKGNLRDLILINQSNNSDMTLNMILVNDDISSPIGVIGITNEGNTLVNGTDYTVNQGMVTIKKGLLTKLGTGTVNLVLNFGKEHLAVTMSTNATEISATMTLYEDTLTSITNGNNTLVNGTDYTVNGNDVIIKKSYLSTLSTGTVPLVFNFSGGGSQTLNVTVTNSTIKNHKVTFEDYDGSPIGEVQTVNYGESATAPAAPTRTGYVFAGWDKTFDNVTGDLVVKATYTSGNTYPFQSTTDKDGSGETKISTDYLKSRDNTLVITNPTADLAIPASAIDLVDGADHIKVTEKVVTPETNTVQGLFSNLPSGVVKMIGNPINLNVQLLKADDTTVVKEIHEFGNNQKVKVTIKLTPNQILGLDTSTLSMYYYDETSNVWDPIGGSFDPNTNEFTFYTPHFTNFAIMDKVSTPPPTVTSYTVTFKDYDGTVIGTPQSVSYGGSATAPAAPVREGYTFTGWDKTFNNVTGNLVVTAQYSINNYTVTFKDYDGKTIGDVQTVKYGESATAPAAPIRTGYVFAGWDKTFDKVTGDLVVTATYKSGNTYNFKPTTTNTGDETKIPVEYLTSRDNTLVITSGNTEISIPAGAIDLADGTGYIKVTEQSEAAAEVSKQFGSLPKGFNQVGNPLLLSIQLFDANNNYIKDVHKLGNNEKIKVTMKFTPDQLKGVISGGITMYYYDETAKAWNKLEGSFDSNTMEMTFYMTTL